MRRGTKTVTRRVGWRDVAPGERLLAVEKAMGLSKGERQTIIGEIRVESVTREHLYQVTDEDVVREGFPGLTASAFVARFCEAFRCAPSTVVTRIEFSYPEDGLR